MKMNIRILFRFFMVAIALSVTPKLSAQTPRFFNVSSGLHSSLFNDLYQDSDGFIWISTMTGVERYDGSQFTYFQHSPDDALSISEGNVKQVMEDAYGYLWVATSTGLNVYDRHLDTFTTVDLDGDENTHEDVISLNHLGSVDGSDYMIMAVRDMGVVFLDLKSRTVNGERKKMFDSVVKSTVNELYVDDFNRIWVGCSDGSLVVMDSYTLKPLNISFNVEALQSDHKIRYTSFAENPENGEVYIGTFSDGLMLFSPVSMTVRRYSDKDTWNMKIRTLAYSESNTFKTAPSLIIGTENNGIKFLDIHSGLLQGYDASYIPFPIDNFKVHSILIDRENNIWLGAFQSGLALIPDSSDGFNTAHLNRMGLPGFNSACVKAVAEDEDGTFYIATDGAGVFRYTLDKGYKYDDRINSGLTNNSIMDLAIDRHGKLWIATYLDGVFTYKEGEGVKKYTGNGVLAGKDHIWSLAYDGKSDILYVNTVGDGAYMVEVSDGCLARRLEEMGDDYCDAFRLDRDGVLWMSVNNKVMTYDPRAGVTREMKINNLKAGCTVYAFYDSGDGKMWIGCTDGLLEMNSSGKVIKVWNTSSGLSDNDVRRVEGSKDGNIWISSASGISCLNPTDGSVINFYDYDGIRAGELTRGGAFSSSDGRMMFGGTEGLVIFRPESVIAKTRNIPAPHLSVVTLMNERVQYSHLSLKDNLLDSPVAYARSIKVPRGNNVFAIGFAVPEYAVPYRVRYNCSVSGYGNGAFAMDNFGMLNIANLRPGKHQVRVDAFYDGDEDNVSSMDFSIKVAYPWYLSIWAWIVYLLCGGLTLLLINKLLSDARVRREEGAKAEKNIMRLDMFTHLAQEIRTPLFLVMSPLKNLREKEQNANQKEVYNLMYRNVLRINRIVNQFVDLRKVDEGQMKLHFVKTDVVYFIKDIMKSFDNLAQTRNVSFNLTSSAPEQYLWVDQGNFDKIVFNLISASFQNVPDGGTVEVSVSNGSSGKDDFVNIRISSSGSNIATEDLERIFDRFHGGETGLGVELNLAKMLVELHHGTIGVENVDGGVSFILKMPCGCEHLTEAELSATNHHKDLYVKPLNYSETFASVKEDQAEGSVATKGAKKLVVIGDDQDTRTLLKMTFSDCELSDCDDSGKAWDVIAAGKVDAVIIDMNNDSGSGFELCKKIKDYPFTYYVPVVILTSVDDEQFDQKCTDCGVDRFFVKPVSAELLKSAVMQAIAMRETIRSRILGSGSYDYSAMSLPRHEEQIKIRVMDIIRTNISNSEFGVNELCREIGMSRTHLNRKLNEMLGVSPSTLIKDIRMKQAAYLLKSTDNPNISEIAFNVGFSSQSYFSTAFRSYFGQSPSDFILQNKEKSIEIQNN